MQPKRLLLTACFLTIGFSHGVRSQERPAPDPAALPEIKAGVCAFKASDYVAAEGHFRRALEVAPSEKRTYKLLALSLEMQYKKADSSSANQAIGRRAIEAFTSFLAAYPAERTAVMETAQLYRDIEPTNLEKIVADERIAPDVRAEIYVRMSRDSSKCANDLFDRNRQLVTIAGKKIYQFKKPTDQTDLAQAQACASRSVELANRALEMSTDKRSALSELGSAYGTMSMVASWKDDTAAANDLKSKAKASYDQYNAEQKRRDDLEYGPSSKPDADEVRKEQMADAADFVATGKMVRRPTWEQLTDAVHPSYDEIFGPEPRENTLKTKQVVSTSTAWKLFTTPSDGFSAMFPGSVHRDAGLAANTYTSGNYMVMVMVRPLDQPAGVQEPAVQAMAAWGVAHATCNFVRMGGAECDVRSIGQTNVGGHPGSLYRLDQVSCSTIPGVLAVVSTDDRIFVILTRAGDENSADVKRFLSSVRIK